MKMDSLDIDQAKPGTRLSRPVFSQDGRLLLSVGTVLSAEMIAELRRSGVARLSVDNTANAAGEKGEDLPETARRIVKERFRHVDLSSPYSSVIFDLAVERQSRAMLARPGKPVPTAKPAPAFQTRRPDPVKMPAVIDAALRMGTLPVVFHRLVEIINTPSAGPQQVAGVIAADPALSAKLLRLVNSAFYGLSSRVDSISRAVVLVGTGPLVMLAMGATLVSAFKGVPVSLVNMQSFWGHSIACGAAGKFLATHCRAGGGESFFVSGLLHDIARLVLYTQLPTHALYLLTEARRRECYLHDLEKETLGFTHEELGAALLEAWLCPQDLTERVLQHHEPLPASPTPAQAILPLADMLAQGLGYGSSGEVYLHSFDDSAWEALCITPQELTLICRLMDEKVRDMHSMLNAD